MDWDRPSWGPEEYQSGGEEEQGLVLLWCQTLWGFFLSVLSIPGPCCVKDIREKSAFRTLLSLFSEAGLFSFQPYRIPDEALLFLLFAQILSL